MMRTGLKVHWTAAFSDLNGLPASGGLTTPLKQSIHLWMNFIFLLNIYSIFIEMAVGSGGADPAIGSPPILSLGSQQPIRELSVDVGSLIPGAFFEMPPSILSLGGQSGNLFVSTAWTWNCPFIGNILHGSLSPLTDHCRLATRSLVHFADPEQLMHEIYWNRNYYGIFSIVQVGSKILGFVHGENKNEKVGEKKYQGTVNEEVSVDSCFSGYHDGVYLDCWESYNGFVGLVVAEAGLKEKPLEFKDMGPIVWPSAGYLSQTGKKVSSGVRHPTALLQGRHVYLYYQDTSNDDEGGRGWGIKLARMDIEGGHPHSYRFETYFEGQWETSLPPGLPGLRDKPGALGKKGGKEVFSQKGGRASILVTGGDIFRFSIAKVKNTASLFLSVEESVESSVWYVKLRTSVDLIHWSPPVQLLKEPGGWDNGTLHYPTLLNKSGMQDGEIDLDDFYVIGSYHRKSKSPTPAVVHISAGVTK